MSLLKAFEKRNIDLSMSGKVIPDFKPGDTLKVSIKIKEGANERVQAYEGVCIARSNKGIGSNFTVRKISYGIGVERCFILYSPLIASIDLVKKGVVRRAKLYYMRKLQGKSARIRERIELYTGNNSPQSQEDATTL